MLKATRRRKHPNNRRHAALHNFGYDHDQRHIIRQKAQHISLKAKGHNGARHNEWHSQDSCEESQPPLPIKLAGDGDQIGTITASVHFRKNTYARSDKDDIRHAKTR